MNAKPDLLTQIFGFLTTIAHYIGVGVIQLVQKIIPSATGLTAIADPIGYLAILTVFVVLTGVARKVALIIVLVGWALILIRILLMAFHVG